MPGSALTAAQTAALRQLADRLPARDLDRLWIFDPQVGKTRETGLIVVSLRGAADESRRTLITVRYTAEQRKDTLHLEEVVTEEGMAPPESIERVIAGVLSRVGDTSAEPLEAQFEEGEESWLELVERLGRSG